jgi:hypothetical protein
MGRRRLGGLAGGAVVGGPGVVDGVDGVEVGGVEVEGVGVDVVVVVGPGGVAAGGEVEVVTAGAAGVGASTALGVWARALGVSARAGAEEATLSPRVAMPTPRAATQESHRRRRADLARAAIIGGIEEWSQMLYRPERCLSEPAG